MTSSTRASRRMSPSSRSRARSAPRRWRSSSDSRRCADSFSCCSTPRASSSDRPTTSHRVDGSTLHLSETGCRDNSVRCDVEFRVHLPAAATAYAEASRRAANVAERDHLVRQAARARALASTA